MQVYYKWLKAASEAAVPSLQSVHHLETSWIKANSVKHNQVKKKKKDGKKGRREQTSKLQIKECEMQRRIADPYWAWGRDGREGISACAGGGGGGGGVPPLSEHRAEGWAFDGGAWHEHI